MSDLLACLGLIITIVFIISIVCAIFCTALTVAEIRTDLNNIIDKINDHTKKLADKPPEDK